MPKAADYSKCQIYKIVCKDPKIKDCYVGNTCNWIKRKSKHKQSVNCENDKGYNYKKGIIIRENGGWNNWEMVLIENFPCENDLQARSKEREWLEKLGATMNGQNPIATKEDIKIQYKKYYEEHREEVKAKSTKYYAEHREELNAKATKYYAEHREEQNAKKAKYYEEHREELNAKATKYYAEHREEKKVSLAKYYEEHCEEVKAKNRERSSKKMTCPCGIEHRVGEKSRHIKTAKHIAWEQAKDQEFVDRLEREMNELIENNLA